jgi:hypothetical protein
MRWIGPRVVVLCLVLSGGLAHAVRRCGDDVDGRAVPCDCGDVLVSSRTLGGDDPITSRTCPGAGLLVDLPPGRSATLALGGRNLVGSGRGYGVQVFRGGDGLAIVGPGAVQRFGVGVFANRGGVTKIADVTAAENAGDGFDIVGDGYAVSGCEAVRNGRDGFALRGRGFRVDGNRAAENARNGFAAAGRAATIGAARGNESAGNGRDGFRIRGRGHEVDAATASGNRRHAVVARGAGNRIADAAASGDRGPARRAGACEGGACR